MPKVVWTSENDRRLLIRLIERSAKSYDTVELCKIFPGATPKAIEERIAKLKREAKAMDHPKPRNHPKGKSGPKKRPPPVALKEDEGAAKRIKTAEDDDDNTELEGVDVDIDGTDITTDDVVDNDINGGIGAVNGINVSDSIDATDDAVAVDDLFVAKVEEEEEEEEVLPDRSIYSEPQASSPFQASIQPVMGVKREVESSDDTESELEYTQGGDQEGDQEDDQEEPEPEPDANDDVESESESAAEDPDYQDDAFVKSELDSDADSEFM